MALKVRIWRGKYQLFKQRSVLLDVALYEKFGGCQLSKSVRTAARLGEAERLSTGSALNHSTSFLMLSYHVLSCLV